MLMKRLCLTVALLTALILPSERASAQTVHSSVISFFESLQLSPPDTIEAKVFSLIDLSKSEGSHVQSTIAGMAFDFFSKSNVMGVEKVAVDVARKYFLSGELQWEGSSTLAALEYYVQFNELSQIGCPAPDLWMESITGEWISLRGLTSGRTVLFFYSAQCSTCRKNTEELVSLLASYDGDPLTVVAVFSESDRNVWEKYVEEHFRMAENSKVTFVHLWDPEAQTGFHKKYAVMTTPQLYLLDQQNVIIGRKLTVNALGQMLDNAVTEDRQYSHLFDRIFKSLEPLQEGDAARVTDALAQKSGIGGPSVDSILFLESMQALFQYLRFSEDAELQNGAIYLAENYIVARPEFWSEEFVSRIAHQLAQQKLNPVDSKATNLVLKDEKGRRRSLLNFKRHRYNIVLFHLVGCRECNEMIDSLVRHRMLLYGLNTGVTLVYAGESESEWKEFVKSHPRTWRYLHDPDGESLMRTLYDLEYVPHIYLLDENNIIVAKDIKIDTLFTLLNVLQPYPASL